MQTAEQKPKARKPEYPADHKAGMRVTKGGSMCENCRYLSPDFVEGEPRICLNKYFIKWHGSNMIPAPVDQYCSDWWESK